MKTNRKALNKSKPGRGSSTNLCPCGTCLPHVTNSKRGRLKIWLRKAPRSLVVFITLILVVFVNSSLSLIIVTCESSGSRMLSGPLLFTLNSFGGFDLNVEYEIKTTSGVVLCISKRCLSLKVAQQYVDNKSNLNMIHYKTPSFRYT